MRFSDKVCIVTGGASGIGAKTAELFVEQGGKVIIADVNDELGEALCDEIGTEHSAYIHTDVTDPEACEAAVEFSVKQWGQIDYLLNSAIKMAPGMLKELPLQSWNLMLNIGLTGTFLMTQAVGRWMIDNNQNGSIVTMSSVGGRQPYSMTGGYSTVKAAVIMLAKHFAIEWAKNGIRVNSICAGHTETPLTVYMKDPEIKKARDEVTPLQRVGQPQDIANSVLFLFSDEAEYITAAALDVDGGLSMSLMGHMPGRRW